MSLGGAVSAAASRDGLLESATQINATFARLRGEEAGPAGACASVSAAPYLLTVVMVISREPARGEMMIHKLFHFCVRNSPSSRRTQSADVAGQ